MALFELYTSCRQEATRTSPLIVFPLRIAHVTGLEELLVHSESAREFVLGLSMTCDLKVVTQHLAVLRRDAVIDDFFGTLTRTLATQISYTLFGHQHFDTVLGVIEVGDHRHDGRDSAVLGRGGGGEDREVGVTSEIA